MNIQVKATKMICICDFQSFNKNLAYLSQAQFLFHKSSTNV